MIIIRDRLLKNNKLDKEGCTEITYIEKKNHINIKHIL